MKNETQGWVLTGAGMAFEEKATLQDLKTVSTLNKDKWLSLGQFYKVNGQTDKCEICYLAARYCDVQDKDLMREWLAVYTLNRAEEKSKEQLLATANMINEALFEVVASDERVMNEMQHLLFALEDTASRG